MRSIIEIGIYMGGVSGWLITLLYTKFKEHLNIEAIVGWMTQIWRDNAIWVVNTQHRHPNFTLIKPLNICTYENQWFSSECATWHNDSIFSYDNIKVPTLY